MKAELFRVLQNGQSVDPTVGSAGETGFLQARVGWSRINLNFSTSWKRRPRNAFFLGNNREGLMRQWGRWGITELFLAAKDDICSCSFVNNQGTNFKEYAAFSTHPLRFDVVFPMGGPTCHRSQKWCLVGLRWGFWKLIIRPCQCTGTTWILTNTAESSASLKRKKHSEVCVLSMTLSPKNMVSVSDAVFTSLKQNWMQGCCSFKSATTKSRISLNMHTNTHREAKERVTAAKLTRSPQKTQKLQLYFLLFSI
jgi:hypothetical protein